MALTSEQYATLKAAILADPVLNAYPNTPDGNFNMCAEKLNVNLVPEYVVWKNSVSIAETGQAFNGVEWANKIAADITRLSCVADYFVQGYNPSDADVRAMFDDIWSSTGGAITRANLAALWKRAALYGEKILATGAGTTASPSTMGYVGAISPTDVQVARSN